MKLTQSLLYVSGAVLFLALAVILTGNPFYVKASDATVIPATVATSSNPTVGTTGVLVFATSTCSARIVTTYASPVMITFSDRIGQVPTGTYGHLQAASTTVAYDGGLYGCGAMKMYGFVSSAITVSESR